MMTVISIIGAVAFIGLCIFPGTYLGTMVAFTHSSDNVIGTFGRCLAFVIVSVVVGFISLLLIVFSPVIYILNYLFSHNETHWYKGYRISYDKELKRWMAYDTVNAFGEEINARRPEDLVPVIEKYIKK